jgi:beta-glucanase (GH16 family)
MCFIDLFKKKPSLFDLLKAGYKLIFSDDFKTIDWLKWDWREPWSGDQDTSKGITYWRKECAVIMPDGLHLIAKRDGNRNACGMICSHRFLRITPGCVVEAIAKVPAGGYQFFPCVIWGYGAKKQEIDHGEFFDPDSRSFNVTHHWQQTDGSSNCDGIKFTNPVDLSLDFHNYTFEWLTNKLTWYLDGVSTWSTTANIPTESMYLISNIQAGGNPAFSRLFNPGEGGEMVLKSIKIYK